jgi:hypothetical protein
LYQAKNLVISCPRFIENLCIGNEKFTQLLIFCSLKNRKKEKASLIETMFWNRMFFGPPGSGTYPDPSFHQQAKKINKNFDFGV